MTQHQHLIPTVVVDRNSKITTVHKKPNTPVKEATFGKPVLPAAKPTDKMTGQEIANTIIKRLKKLTPPAGYPSIKVQPHMRKDLLEASDNIEYIRRIHSLFETLASGEESTHFQAIITILNDLPFEDHLRINVLCAHADYVLERPNAVLEIAFFGSRLISEGIVKTDADGRIASLKAHFKAKSHYFKQYGEQYGYYEGNDISDYRKNHSYMEAVEVNHDRIDALLSYRDLRGIRIVDGKDTFEQSDFQQYLEQGAVANGWL